MDEAKRFLRRCATWERWQLLYIVLSISWLLGPALNPHPSVHGAFISQYEDPGQPWSLLFRMCDILAALVLGLAVYVIARRRRSISWSVILLAIIAVGSFIDDAFPSHCGTKAALCFLPHGLLPLVHSTESAITTSALLLLNLIWILKKSPWAKTVLFIQVFWIVVFAANQLHAHSGSTFVQFAYQVVVTLWVAQIVPVIAGHDKAAGTGSRSRLITHVIAAWIFFSGFLTIVNVVRNVKEISDLSSAYFGNNTAWLSQHGVAVGVALMYISRHLWRSEYRAWQLASLLLWLETLKYSLISPNAWLVVLYGLTASVLFMQQGSFNRVTSTEELKERLKKLLFVVTATIAALLAGLLALRLKHHQDIDTLKLNIPQFTRHLFLFDVVNDLGPLPRRLLGQVLNVAGLTLLFAILISLFRPQKPLLRPANEYDRQQLLGLLGRGSNSSEDYFKYWPQPKNYWWSSGRGAVVTYQVVGNVAFALADPTAPENRLRKQAGKEFLEYCRQNGWRACFLMVSEKYRPVYKDNGYKLLRIGASALVDIEEFSARTVRNKWWRWVLNKSKKQEWQYRLASPPHDKRLISELRRVSDIWLGQQNHVERGFALGYFDKDYLRSCRLHLLLHEGKVIAFANELPTFNKVSTATIDLMRYLPDYKHAMPALLAQSIQQLSLEGVKKEFDLGFVPLASPAAKTEQIIQKLGQLLMSEAVSAQGLEQFKNKFEPAWANNYIAFDGDWIDLLHITRQLDNLLRP